MKEGQSSFTALFIGLVVIMLGNHDRGVELLPEGIVPMQCALLEAVDLDWKSYLWFRLVTMPLLGPVISRMTIGLVGSFCKDALEAVAFRKSFIERQVRDFVFRHRHPQVLILGVGYDTLSLRLMQDRDDKTASGVRSIPIFEVDHPATGSVKERMWLDADTTPQKGHTSKQQAAICILGGTKPSNVHSMKVDLTADDSLAKKLLDKDNHFDPSTPTIVIMEGVLIYFTKDQVEALFGQLGRVLAPGSLAVFDMLATTYDPISGRRHANLGSTATMFGEWLVKIKGEPLLVGWDPTLLKGFLAQNSTTWKMHVDVQAFGPTRVAAIEFCAQ